MSRQGKNNNDRYPGLPLFHFLVACFSRSFTLASHLDHRSIGRLEQKNNEKRWLDVKTMGLRKGKGDKHNNSKHLVHSYLQAYPHVTTTTTISPQHENSSGAKEKWCMWIGDNKRSRVGIRTWEGGNEQKIQWEPRHFFPPVVCCIFIPLWQSSITLYAEKEIVL